jgi:hypothetical protein
MEHHTPLIAGNGGFIRSLETTLRRKQLLKKSSPTEHPGAFEWRKKFVLQ